MSKRMGSEASRATKRPRKDPPQPRAVGWSRNDQMRLDATKGPDWTTWKRFRNLMSKAYLFHYALRSAISCRTGGEAPDKQTLPQRSNSHKGFVKMIQKAIEDLKQSRGRHSVENPKSPHLADLHAVIKAWDISARSASLLRIELKTIKGDSLYQRWPLRNRMPDLKKRISNPMLMEKSCLGEDESEDDDPKSNDPAPDDLESYDPESEDDDPDKEDHRLDEPGLEDNSMPGLAPLDLDNKEDFGEPPYDNDWDLNDYPEL
ncbi:hypothetical protein IFR04_007090 [Cadophora malorum]|uniref:Uncharacterized protein n=1 Tax=Cadophora malorum TaxID=108018 RepID=A0A8H7TIH7_9HELO|nr:hypothetical protein IFR04_007090 [Cadophora malorum]